MVTAQDVTWVTELPSYQTAAASEKVIPWKRFSIALDYDYEEENEKYCLAYSLERLWEILSENINDREFQINYGYYLDDIYFLEWKNDYYFLADGIDWKELPMITENNLHFAIAMDWIVLANERVQDEVRDLITESWLYGMPGRYIIDFDDYDFRPLIGKKIWKNKMRG